MVGLVLDQPPQILDGLVELGPWPIVATRPGIDPSAGLTRAGKRELNTRVAQRSEHLIVLSALDRGFRWLPPAVRIDQARRFGLISVAAR